MDLFKALWDEIKGVMAGPSILEYKAPPPPPALYVVWMKNYKEPDKPYPQIWYVDFQTLMENTKDDSRILIKWRVTGENQYLPMGDLIKAYPVPKDD